MTTREFSRGEFADRGFCWGFIAGACVAFVVCVMFSVVNTFELARAAEDIGGGPPGFLAHVEYLMWFPAVIAGTGITALLGGALGIVTGKVLHRMLRRNADQQCPSAEPPKTDDA